MFRFSTIIKALAPNLAKVIFILKHSVKLRRYLLCGCVAACCNMLPHKLPDDGRRPKHVEEIFMCILICDF
jgi:hypothetical protein